MQVESFRFYRYGVDVPDVPRETLRHYSESGTDTPYVSRETLQKDRSVLS